MIYRFSTLLVALPAAYSSRARPMEDHQDESTIHTMFQTNVVIPFVSDLSFPTAYKILGTIETSEGSVSDIRVFVNMMPRSEGGFFAGFAIEDGQTIESSELIRFESIHDPLTSFVLPPLTSFVLPLSDPIPFISSKDYAHSPMMLVSISQDSVFSGLMEQLMIVHNSTTEGVIIINPVNPGEYLADGSTLSVALLHGEMGYLVPVEIDLGYPFDDERSTKGNHARGEGLIQLGAMDPTFHSTTVPHEIWEEFRKSLERFGSIEEHGEYFDIHGDTADLSSVFASLPSLEFSVQLMDGSSHFVLPLSHTDYLVPTAISSRFRLLINKQFSGDYPRLGNNLLNKFAIILDAKNRRIAFGTPKKEVIASRPTF